jgi:DNA relaxase NicK
VAVDIPDDDLAFDLVAKVAIDLAHERGTRTSLVGDWATPGAPAGRTLYIGSRKSAVYVRIYEHGKLHGGNVSCRIEAEVKPDKKPGKLQLATLSAAGVAGCSAYMVLLCQRFGIDIDRVPLAGYVRQISELQQQLVRLWMQYGRILDAQMQEVDGDVEAFTAALFAARDDLERRRAKAALAAARPKAVPLICL